jgi:uncharacterized Ntn-hydrolase superfamily protein
LVNAGPASATWSIVIVDSDTREVAIGTVTCLTGLDLLGIVPVVVVGQGAAACQAAGDFDGLRRPIIFNGLKQGVDPVDILAQVAGVSGHQFRQYGIADTQGRTLTFQGTDVDAQLQWAGGVAGSVGSLHYAIQGNVLSGACVLQAMEQAVIASQDDIPGKLMAGMIAARDTGGDGRCSCSNSNPTLCGCPSVPLGKSGHIGGMIVSRLGDTDDAVCSASGCADGDYFMRLNVAGQNSGSPDPVDQLENLFNSWRTDLVGRPDAGMSLVDFTQAVTAGSGTEFSMLITLRDWQPAPITVAIESVTVAHAPNSEGLATIGPVVELGGGVFSVSLDAGGAIGSDRFVVTVDDGVRLVVLMPIPSVTYQGAGAPAVATWGVTILLLAVLVCGSVVFIKRRLIFG